MSPVFGEHHRASSKNASTQHRLKERRALMSVQNLHIFTIRKFFQSSRTPAINSRLPMQMLDRYPILLQPFADFSDLIQHSHDAAEFSAHATHHLVNQHFGTAHAKRVNNVADGRT